MIDLLCPKDKIILKRSNNSYYCSMCKSIFSIVNGVVRLVDKTHDFYEGMYLNTVNRVPKKEKGYSLFLLWVINNGYLWYSRKHIPAGSLVLELGCAGGIKYFANRFRMIGADISFTSLKNPNNNYHFKLQADVTKLIPIPNNSVDAVISSYFWEHLNKYEKIKLLKEIYRVLKPNGKIVFLFDVDTKNPLLKRIKTKHPYFYKKFFLEKDCHYGYHTPTENIHLFNKYGFDIIETFGMEKTIFQSPSVYTKLCQVPSASRFFYQFINFLSIKFLKPYIVFLRLLDVISKDILPDSWSRIFLIVAKKKYEYFNNR